jgi:hypothetical protein
MFIRLLSTAALVLSASAAIAQADIRISISNQGNSDFFLTPLWFGLHDGSFDLFSPGVAATPGLKLVAEQGDISTLNGEFAAANAPGAFRQGVVTGPQGFGSVAGQPPVIDPGETGSTTLSPINPAAYRYFSFASMVIPSNDSFIGNGDPMGYEVFDAAGNFNGAITITLLGSDIYDAGTEVNNTIGAAFSTVGGAGTVEGGTVAQLAAGGLDNFLGTGIPPGGTIQNLISPNRVLATITITQVPEPASLGIWMLGAFGVIAMRRRK